MILTLPVSHLIDAHNYHEIPGVKALEYKKEQPVFDYSGPQLFHSGKGVTDHDFIDYFDALLPYLKSHKFSHFSFDVGPAAEPCNRGTFRSCNLPVAELPAAEHLWVLNLSVAPP